MIGLRSNPAVRKAGSGHRAGIPPTVQYGARHPSTIGAYRDQLTGWDAAPLLDVVRSQERCGPDWIVCLTRRHAPASDHAKPPKYRMIVLKPRSANAIRR